MPNEAADAPIATLADFLASCDLKHLIPLLQADFSHLRSLDRLSLLSTLRAHGVERLQERQKFANALAKAERAGKMATPRPNAVQASSSQPEPSPRPIAVQPLPAQPEPEPPRQPAPSQPSLPRHIEPAELLFDVSDAALQPMARPYERSELLRRFDAFYRQHAWQRLESVESVYATSDLHAENVENLDFLRNLQPRPHDALIVAGDAATGSDKLALVLRLLVGKFKYVFFCAGNHELWKEPGETSDGVEKLLRLMELAVSLGAYAAPALLGGRLDDPALSGNAEADSSVEASSRTTADADDDGVAIVPLQSWYQPHFADGFGFDSARAEGLDMTRMMDNAVQWPKFLADESAGPARCSEFFAELNEPILAEAHRPTSDDGCLLRGWDVVSFSHFLPRPELHRGYSWLSHFEGSHALGRQLDRLYAAAHRPGDATDKRQPRRTHIFGHTHFSIDEVLDGVRYVQHPLGNPRERQNGWQVRTSPSNPFARVWMRPKLPSAGLR